MMANEIPFCISIGAWVQSHNISDIVDKTTGHQGFFVSRVECSDWTSV